MFNSTVLSTQTHYYYPLGTSPAVCLTQDLTPEQDAHILCLECGDARHVLFTCYADCARRIDVTCCDTEPGIHARNILLYTLLINDKANENVESIWNIYYHWKLDRASADLLQRHISKLLSVSTTIEKWHGSTFGTLIRFCDARSLSLVRAYWLGFRLQGVAAAQKKERLNQLQYRISKAKAHRDVQAKNDVSARSLSLVGTHAARDLSEIARQWWNCGTTGSSFKVTELNPAFLFSPNKALVLHYELSPLLGFPVSTAYVPIAKGSDFHVERREGVSSTNYLVKSAKSHFNLWACAFRKAVENKSVIRVFCGDPLAFGCTLHNCQLTGATSMNLFCDTLTCSPLTLCERDYGGADNMAPVSFDVIDTSGLADRLGPLNVIGVASSLLKHHASSSLYTEMSVQRNVNLSDHLSGFFGVDARTMSLLFGLVLPELFTNATDSPEDASPIIKSSKPRHSDEIPVTLVCARLRWKRSLGCAESHVHVGARVLAKLLIQVHKAMFIIEDEEDDDDDDDDNDELLFAIFGIPFRPRSKLKKSSERVLYSRASFAFFLNRLKSTVVSDWDACFNYIYNTCSRSDSLAYSMSDFVQDLLVNLHVYGVDNDILSKPTADELDGAILMPILPLSLREHIPEQLCITVRVPRESLRMLESKEFGTWDVVCCLKGKDRDGEPWLSMFSTVQIVFGTCYAETNRDSYPYIEEDTSRLSGSSDMFASFMVPTWVLLQSKGSVPIVKCGVPFSDYDESGLRPCFVHSKMTSQNVFVSRYLPGIFALPNYKDLISHKPKSALTTVQLIYDGSKINTLTQRVTLESAAVKAKLADKSSTVSVSVKSPLIAIVNMGQSEKLKVELPLPLSFSKPVVRIARKSAYVEIESPLFDPLNEDASTFIFPTVIAKGSTVPTIWNTTRINLDVMPPMNINDNQTASMLTAHLKMMFSSREQIIRESNGSDARTSLKNGLAYLFLQYAGRQTEIFELSKGKVIQTLIFPSCLRLDLVNHTVVLDAAVVPLAEATRNDSRVQSFLQELTSHNIRKIKVTESDNNAWKAILPAFVERCRAWKHSPDCEYVLEDETPICSCGCGKFPPEDYLKSQVEKIADFSYVMDNYASRAAIAPVFAVPYVEECFRKGEVNSNNKSGGSAPKENCARCSQAMNEARPCSRCKKVSYCSRACQKAHWRKHNAHCRAV